MVPVNCSLERLSNIRELRRRSDKRQRRRHSAASIGGYCPYEPYIVLLCLNTFDRSIKSISGRPGQSLERVRGSGKRPHIRLVRLLRPCLLRTPSHAAHPCRPPASPDRSVRGKVKASSRRSQARLSQDVLSILPAAPRSSTAAYPRSRAKQPGDPGPWRRYACS